MNPHARTYFDTLLHRKRGDYGPLALFELDSVTWAIVWQECLDDEEACRLILSEDPSWFNQQWGKDGRRPNPTYETQREALDEIIRSLWIIKANMATDDKKQSHYSAYISHAEYDLHRQLTDRQIDLQYPHELFASVEGMVHAPRTRLAPGFAPELEHSAAEAVSTPPAPALQAAAAKAKPWEDLSAGSKGVLLPMTPALYAKMKWVTENVPKMSLQKIAKQGAEAEADRLIALHYKDD